MNEFHIRQLDANGNLLSVQQVTAHDYVAVLRQLKEIFDETQRIEVYNDEGEKSGEISAGYWRQKGRRK